MSRLGGNVHPLLSGYKGKVNYLLTYYLGGMSCHFLVEIWGAEV